MISVIQLYDTVGKTIRLCYFFYWYIKNLKWSWENCRNWKENKSKEAHYKKQKPQ